MALTPAEGRLERFIEAILAVGEDLDLDAVLERIVIAACGLVNARYGALGVLDDSGTSLERFVHHGIDVETAARIGPLPTGFGLLGQLVRDPRPLRLERLSDHAASSGLPSGHPPMDSFIGTPVRVQGAIYGNLYLTAKRSGEPFSAEDEAAVVALATVAGSAIANARLVARSAELLLVRERDRIARDLHDTVIQNLFATGLGLQAVQRSGLATEDGQERLARAIESIDATIKEIRATIFALHDTGRPGETARGRFLAVVEEIATLLGFAPHVQLDGPIDTVVDAALADQLVPVLRESLTNVAKHARATRVAVRIEVLATGITIEVTDDGVGFPEIVRSGGMGLVNLESRADGLGGRVEFGSVDGGGARVVWSIPV